MTYSAALHSAALATAPSVNRDPHRDGGLSVWYAAEQDNKCFDCGLERPLEFAHFVKVKGSGSSKGRAGGAANSLIPVGAMSCRPCNMRHDAICDRLGTDSNLPIEYLMADGRADRIPTNLPTRAELVAIFKATVASVHAATVADADEVIARLGL